jgi:hypothetical protein
MSDQIEALAALLREADLAWGRLPVRDRDSGTHPHVCMDWRAVPEPEMKWIAAWLVARNVTVPLREPPDDVARFCDEVRVELGRASAAWPDGDVYIRLAALMGEAGELAQGTIKQRSVEELRAEAVQVAVTAYRVVRVLELNALAAQQAVP